MIKKRSFFCLFIILTMFLSYAISEKKSIPIGDTGISFSVDSSYEVVTSNNKGSYSQKIQQLLSSYGDKVILIMTSNGSIIISFDTANYYDILETKGKKNDVILQLFDQTFKQAEFEKYLGSYSLSIYDSGTDKWVRVFFKSQNYYQYATVRNKTEVVLTFTSEFTPKEIEPIIDTFQF